MEPPSPSLVTSLRELRLAGPKELRSAARQCRRLAVDLPTFDSVWIDALVRLRRLTPFQAQVLQTGGLARLRVGDFVLVDRLGAGCNSVTYLAQSLADGRTVVLKGVTASPDRHSVLVESLCRLTHAAKALRSHHVVAPDDVFSDEDRIVLVSRFAPGYDARSWLIRQGRLEPAMVGEIGRQLLFGLDEAHRCGLTHGDIRIANVRLTSGGEAVLVDLGVRPVVSPSLSIQETRPPEWYAGTAPERIGTGAPASPPSDVYSLGCVLWQLLAGRPPFPMGDPLVLLAGHRSRRIPDVLDFAPDTPTELAKAVHEMTARDPSDRPTDCAELARRIRPGATARRLLGRSRPSHRNGAFPWLAAAIVLFALTGAAFFLADRTGGATLLSAPFVRKLDLISSADSTGTNSRLAAMPAPDARGVVSLTHAGPFETAEIAFHGSLVIRGRAEQPSTLVVGDRPLHLWAEDVTLEHVNVVQAKKQGSPGPTALVLVEAQHLTLRSCRFECDERSDGERSTAPAGVTWRLVNRTDPTAGRVVLADCVFRSVRDAVVFADPPRRVTATNVLGIGCRSLLLVKSPDRAMVTTSLENVTLRDVQAVIAIEGAVREAAVEVVAHDSIFDLSSDGSLFLDRTASGHCRLSWRGLGVVTSGEVDQVGRRESRSAEVEPEPTAVTVEGIMIATVNFAGPAHGSDAASVARLTGVPRRADRPPGIDLSRLPRASQMAAKR